MLDKQFSSRFPAPISLPPLGPASTRPVEDAGRSGAHHRSRNGRRILGVSLTVASHLAVFGLRVAVAVPPADTLAYGLFTDSQLTQRGLVGSYVGRSMQDYPQQDDWRTALPPGTITGTRVDTTIAFEDRSWGTLASVGLAEPVNGHDNDWENFSVQWDGYIQILDDCRVATKSDDASRMWIDLNQDGVFASSGDEFVDNLWGQEHAPILGPESRTIAPGAYKIRIQYYEISGGNVMDLVVRRLLLPLGTAGGRQFYLTSGAVSIDSAKTLAAEIAARRSTRCYLATDDSRELHEWLKARLTTRTLTPTTSWIGLSDAGAQNERVWRWDSGEDYSLAFWQTGSNEPNGGLNENHVVTGGDLGGGWMDSDGSLFPAVLEVYEGCLVPGDVLKATDAPADDGHRIELDWTAYSAPAGATFRVYRSHELCLLSAQTVPLGSTPTKRFVDQNAPDYGIEYYRVDVEVGGNVVDALVSGSAVAHPNLVIGRVDPAGNHVQIRNLSPTSMVVDGFHLGVRSRDEYRYGVVTLSGTIPAGATTNFDVGAGLLESGARLFLMPPDTEYRMTSAVGGAVSSIAYPNAFDGYQPGLPVRVDVPIFYLLTFEGGKLFARRGGSRVTWSDDLRIRAPGSVPTAVIPDSLVGARGIEYWVVVQTSDGPYTDPPDQPESEPIRLRVTAPIAEAAAQPGGIYRMVSIPLEFQNQDLWLGDVFSLRLGAYDARKWRLYAYDPADGAYTEWNANATDSIFRAAPGRACWLVTRDPYRIDTGRTLLGRSVPTDAPYDIRLRSGWNQVGNPFAFPIAWDQVIRDSALVDKPMRYEPWHNPPYADFSHGILPPFEGVFVYNASSQDQWISIPPIEAGSAPLPAIASHALEELGWRLVISIRDEHGVSDAVEVGAEPGASTDRDPGDERKAPPPPDRRVVLSVDDSGFSRFPGDYQRDVRPLDTSGHEWALRIRVPSEVEALTLDSRLVGRAPAGFRAAAFLGTGEIIDLFPGGMAATSAPVPSPAGRPGRSLRIVAGTGEYVQQAIEELPVPGTLELREGQPNPFRSSVAIRFGLPRSERVTLGIYDTQGRRLRRMLEAEPMPAGFHSVTWTGTGDDGALASSGLYFVRLRTTAGLLTRKIIRVR